MAVFEDLMRPLSADRRAHSIEVGRKAAAECHRVRAASRPELSAAATLHDIGYGYPVTGFHPLDGATFLALHGFSPLVCRLVAHHSASTIEAQVRGIPGEEFERFAVDLDPAELDVLDGVLWWADMTTGPEGSTVRVEDRLAEIVARYGPDDLVTTFIERARPVLLAAGQSPTGSK